MTDQENVKRQASKVVFRAIESLDKETTSFYNRIGDVNADVVRDIIESDDAGAVIFKLVKDVDELIRNIDAFKYRLEEQVESLKEAVDEAITLRNELLEEEEEEEEVDDEYCGPIVYAESYRI